MILKVDDARLATLYSQTKTTFDDMLDLVDKRLTQIARRLCEAESPRPSSHDQISAEMRSKEGVIIPHPAAYPA